MSTKDKIEEVLKKSFNIYDLKIIDDSDKHSGHAEALKSGGGHFSITVISPDFEGKSLVERHRMINNALKDQFQELIHALAIKALVPETTS